MPAQPGQHQPVAALHRAAGIGFGLAVGMFGVVLGIVFGIGGRQPLALLGDGDQHRQNQRHIAQGDQPIQRHGADRAGACGHVQGVEHHGKPRQKGCTPGVARERGRGQIVNGQQAPAGALGHQGAGADRQKESRHKRGFDPRIRHALQARGHRIDGAQMLNEHQAGQARQHRAHQQQPHGQAGAAQAAVRRLLRRCIAVAQVAQAHAHREHQQQRNQQAAQRGGPAMGFHRLVKGGLALARQRAQALQVQRQQLGKLLPQRGRQRRGRFAGDLGVELLGAHFLDGIGRLRRLHRQQLAALDGRVQVVVLLAQVFALAGDFGAFLCLLSLGAELGNTGIELLEQRLQRGNGGICVALGLQRFVGQGLQGLGRVGVIQRLAHLVQCRSGGLDLLLRGGLGFGQHLGIGGLGHARPGEQAQLHSQQPAQQVGEVRGHGGCQNGGQTEKTVGLRGALRPRACAQRACAGQVGA